MISTLVSALGEAVPGGLVPGDMVLMGELDIGVAGSKQLVLG